MNEKFLSEFSFPSLPSLFRIEEAFYWLLCEPGPGCPGTQGQYHISLLLPTCSINAQPGKLVRYSTVQCLYIHRWPVACTVYMYACCILYIDSLTMCYGDNVLADLCPAL